MAFSALLKVSLLAEMTGALDIERLRSTINRDWAVSLGDGTGAGQGQTIWSDTRTLASGANESIDLFGTMKDAFGKNVALAKMKMLVIVADSANTTVLTVGNVANGIADPFLAATGGILVRPGGLFVVAAPDDTGFPIVTATQDLLKVANAAGAAANYDIVVIGV